MGDFTDNFTHTITSTVNSFGSSINNMLNSAKGVSSSIPDLNKITKSFNK